MTTVQEFRGEICGRISNNLSRWLVIQGSNAEPTVLKWNSGAKIAPGARHFGREAHTQVYISRWFESVCVPPRTDFISMNVPLSCNLESTKVGRFRVSHTQSLGLRQLSSDVKLPRVAVGNAILRESKPVLDWRWTRLTDA